MLREERQGREFKELKRPRGQTVVILSNLYVSFLSCVPVYGAIWGRTVYYVTNSLRGRNSGPQAGGGGM